MHGHLIHEKKKKKKTVKSDHGIFAAAWAKRPQKEKFFFPTNNPTRSKLTPTKNLYQFFSPE